MTEASSEPHLQLAGLQSWITRNQHFIARFYLVALLVAFGWFSLSLPISYRDTDMWYHLAGGRYLFETGSLYNPFLRSYIEPVREFINYFWGFQALAFALWTAAGPVGLILLKALLLMGSALYTVKLLLADARFGCASVAQLVIIMLVLFLLCGNAVSVRPHLFSHFFIPLFLYILLHRPRWIVLLPFLTVIWVNVHGVEWLVGALICGGWLLARIVDYVSTRDRRFFPQIPWVIACLPATLLNPNGIFVLTTPFITGADLYLFISELMPLDLSARIDLSAGLDPQGAIILLLVVAALALYTALRDCRKNLFHLILAAGALILLMRGYRFVWEWLLLSAPLFSLILRPRTVNRFDHRSLVALLALSTFILYSLLPLYNHAGKRYPLDEYSYPFGTTRFIKELQLSGRYAVPPTYAGYIEWTLPYLRIHSDMQFGPFDEGHFFEIHAAGRSLPAFNRYVAKYQPVLFSVDRENREFAQIAQSAGRYVPVFFDNRLVLYVDRVRYQDIADQYGIEFLDPFQPEQIHANKLAGGIAELKRMLNVVRTLPELQLTLVDVLVQAGELKEAALVLQRLTDTGFEDDRVLFHGARIAHLSGDFKTALAGYSILLSRAPERKQIALFIADCQFLIGNAGRAYEVYKSTINPYLDRDHDLQVYYQFALTSFVVGDHEGALRLIGMIELMGDGSNPDLLRLTGDLKAIILNDAAL